MKPFDFGIKTRYNYTDCHPKKLGKHWINWWEDMAFFGSKRARRQHDKRELMKKLNG